jgi:phage shock protein A
MYKQMIALFRGETHNAVTDITERHAMTILDQQIRDSSAVIAQARRALAIAMAEDGQEAARLEALANRIAGLEDRATAALAAGHEDLALLAAEAIAELETDQETATQARQMFGIEIGRLKARLRDTERRFAALQRGRRLARVGEAVRRSRSFSGALGITDAEETLAALRDRQNLDAAADAAMDDVTTAPMTIELRLGEAGFGPSQPNAQSVLARLKRLANDQTSPQPST